mgnify:CR=1 FL=1
MIGYDSFSELPGIHLEVGTIWTLRTPLLRSAMLKFCEEKKNFFVRLGDHHTGLA